MTPKEAKALWPIFQAFAAGKPIQYKGTNGASPTAWTDIANPSFSPHFDYREKPVPPKPLEVRVWVREETGEPRHIAHTSAVGSTNSGLIVKLFREVVEKRNE